MFLDTFAKQISLCKFERKSFQLLNIFFKMRSANNHSRPQRVAPQKINMSCRKEGEGGGTLV